MISERHHRLVKRKSESWEIASRAGHEVHPLRPERVSGVVRPRPRLPVTAGPAPATQPRSQSRCPGLTQEGSTAPCAARSLCCLSPPAGSAFPLTPGQLQAGRPPNRTTASSRTKTTPAGAR